MPTRHVVAIGGSDAGISAALRIREIDPGTDVTVLVADEFPNYSICGIPYHVSGEVPQWQDLAHRTTADLEATGMHLRTSTRATAIDAAAKRLTVTGLSGQHEELTYDSLVVGTGAVSIRPPILGLSGPNALGPQDGVHLLHSMGDMFDVLHSIDVRKLRHAVVIGAGYIGLEMAEALTTRGISVTQIEALPEVLPTVDPELGALVHSELVHHDVTVATGTTVEALERDGDQVRVHALAPGGRPIPYRADLVLIVVGVRPDARLALEAGAQAGPRGSIDVDEFMRTSLPDVYAAGDCASTYHRLLGPTWLPLGTTAHKQGRVAGENAVGGARRFAGSLGTQVVKVFDLVAARTGLRAHEAADADPGWIPATTASNPDDHKAYYPGSTPIATRITGDARTGLLIGAQLVGHRSAEIAKRVDIFATALFHGMAVDAVNDLDLSYTPPLGSPWDAVQNAAQAWTREHRPSWAPTNTERR